MIITYRAIEEALHESKLDLLDSRYGGSNLELYRGLELVEHLALSLEGGQLPHGTLTRVHMGL